MQYEMKSAIAVKSFRRSDTREYVKRGDTVCGESRYVLELSRKGSVREVKDLGEAPENKAARPKKPSGAALPSSASPAGPASPKPTRKPSGAGGKTQTTDTTDE